MTLIDDGTENWKQFSDTVTIREWAKYSGRDMYRGEFSPWRGFRSFGVTAPTDLLELFEQKLLEMKQSAIEAFK